MGLGGMAVGELEGLVGLGLLEGDTGNGGVEGTSEIGRLDGWSSLFDGKLPKGGGEGFASGSGASLNTERGGGGCVVSVSEA